MRSGYALLHAATREFRERAALELVDPPSASCACCQREWSQVEDPGRAVVYRYDASCSPEYVCTTCYTPRIASPDMLGIERRSKSGKAVYGKLGMLPGSGGVITPSGALHLALPKGFMDKFEGGILGREGRLHQTSAIGLLAHLLGDGEMKGLTEGFVFIETWGRKADVLMRHWRGSYSLQEVWCLSEKGAMPLELSAMIRTATLLVDQGLEKEAVKPPFWSPVINAAKGVRNQKEQEKWSAKVKDHKSLLLALPSDPHNRISMPSYMREIIPCVAEGRL